jgi:hypothetical protein
MCKDNLLCHILGKRVNVSEGVSVVKNGSELK